MESPNRHQFKSFSLSFDEPLLGYTRHGIPTSFQKNDQVRVLLTSDPTPGSLVLLESNGAYHLRRYESILNLQTIFPPSSDLSVDMILGEVVDHIRLSDWLVNYEEDVHYSA